MNAHEPVESVRVLLAHRDEGDGDTGRDTDGVLDVEVLIISIAAQVSRLIKNE